MGYWTEYFSTLLKGTRITSWKERAEVRKVVNNLKKADHILYKSLFEHVEKTHQVTKAIKEEGKLLEELKISSDNAYSLIFNLSTEDITLLKTIEDILHELEAFSKSVEISTASNAQFKKVLRDFALSIFEALKKAEAEERQEFRQVMLIIAESEEKDPKRFMSAIRLAFQRKDFQTMLAKFAARREIRKIKVDILELQKIPRIIEGMREVLVEKVKKDGEQKVIGELYGTIQKIKKYCQDAFLELFLIKKRDMLLVLKVLYDLHTLMISNEKWAKQHFIPTSAALEKNREIVKIQADISKHFHVAAQAFRIMITRIQKLEKEAEMDWSKA